MSRPAMSGILIELAEALEEELGHPDDPAVHADLLRFAVGAWNASRDAAAGDPGETRSPPFEDLPAVPGSERVSDERRRLFWTTWRRARRDHPDDPRRVVHVEVVGRDDGRFQVYTLTDPGETTGEQGDGPGHGIDLEPAAEDAVEEVLGHLRRAGEREDLPDGQLVRGEELLLAHAVAEPEQLLRSRKPEVWAAGAVHAAPLTTFPGYADPGRLTTEEAARLFGVSTASVTDRSTALRESWERLLEAGAHPRLPGVPAGLARIATTVGGVQISSGGDPPGADGNPWRRGGEESLRKRLAEFLGDAGHPPAVDRFDLSGFLEAHVPDEGDRRRLRESAGPAAKAYYREVLGKDPTGRRSPRILSRPAAFGHFLREVLRGGVGSEEARDALALRATATLVDPRGDPPAFVLLAPARLAARGLLAGPPLAAALALALRERRPLDGVRTEELRPLWRALARDEALPPDRRSEGLAALVRGAGAGGSSRRAADLLSAMTRDDRVPRDVVAGLLEQLDEADPSPLLPGKVTPGVRRRALRHLAEMADEPWREAARMAAVASSSRDPERWRAAAEVLRDEGRAAPEGRIRELVRQGLRAPKAGVRQAWYRTGVRLIGGDVKEWAPRDVLVREESRKRRGGAAPGGDPAQTSLF